MKSVAIITPYGNNNFGNKLQNYALQETIKKIGLEPITLKNLNHLNSKKFFLLRKLKNMNKKEIINDRTVFFLDFNKYINYDSNIFNAYSSFSSFDYVIVGSDQVWNPYHGRLKDLDLLKNVEPKKRISYAASFGIDYLPEKEKNRVRKELLKFKYISVRENSAKDIVEGLTNRKDIKVVIDPTMLLTEEHWKKIEKRPPFNVPNNYILTYFLGNVDEQRKSEISRIAKENNCEIISLMDKNSVYYNIGPSEFLYLIHNSFLICTDSFHACVFSILFGKPFIVFDRLYNGANMNSRIDTLLGKLKIEDRKYDGQINEKNMQVNYENAYDILKDERKKAIQFLKKALEMENDIDE